MLCDITVLDSDLVRDTREASKNWKSLSFLHSFSICFARHSTVYLHLRTIQWHNSGLDMQEIRVHVDIHKD